MNEGGYRLSHVWDSLLATPSGGCWRHSSWWGPPVVVKTSMWDKIYYCV